MIIRKILYIGFFASLVPVNSAFAECREADVYLQKLDMTIKQKEGDRHCVVRHWMSKDKMVEGYWLAGKTLSIVINNIRASKDINLGFYGFNDFQALKLAKKIDEASEVRWVKLYNKFGIPKVKIEKKMEYRRK